MIFIYFKIIITVFSTINCLNNGVALTPPMGWMPWQRFQCVTDCNLYPDECISDQLFRSMAEHMVTDGYLEAGYEYLILDDCWSAKERDKQGKLQPDPYRFPYGIQNLSQFVHNKGLKFGIYANYGTYTCAGYPGSFSHLETDARTFAEWEVDYLKFDACYAQGDIEDGYIKMSKNLNATGRPIIFSCSWPAYQEPFGIQLNYTKLVETCNLWRNYVNIEDSWYNVSKIADWFSLNQNRIGKFSGPGHWNDPDMLIIGNYGLSLQQSKAQMTIWCILAAPLIMSVDLRTIDPQFKKILLNKDAIAINQDPLGIMGKLVLRRNKVDVWVKPLQRKNDGRQSFAIGLISHRVNGFPLRFKFSLAEAMIRNSNGFWIRNIFDKNLDIEDVTDSKPIYLRIKPTEGILLLATPHKKYKTCYLNEGVEK